jgi:hypothetical protein
MFPSSSQHAWRRPSAERTFIYGSLEERMPADRPLRPIHAMVDTALKEMSRRFDAIYGEDGRRSIPPERLLPALLLQLALHDSQRALADGATGIQPAVPVVCRALGE